MAQVRAQLSRQTFAGILVAALLVSDATAGETDQYMTWDIELADAAPAFNAYLDEEIHAFVDKMNRRNRKVADTAELTEALYLHLFEGLHASRVRNWLRNSPEIERYPADDLSDWAYQRQSIFREPAFPFILPMAQTIRVGEVYLGIDKVGHMFGFGRRYFQIYMRYREEGATHDEAVERMLAWGVGHERNLVGQLVDGIFSKGDLEANFQGFRLARALSGGESPLFFQKDGEWCYRGGLDIRDYITPDLDESFNQSVYAPWRGRLVQPIIEARYASMADDPAVLERFDRYREGYTPSRSQRFIDAWLEARAMGQPQSEATK